MTAPVRVLYVAPDESTGRRLRSFFADRRPAVALSFVTSVERALRTLDDERIDHVVVDSTVATGADADRVGAARAGVDRSDPAAAVRRGAPDVPVSTIRGLGDDRAADVSTDELRRTRTERTRVLAHRVACAVATEAALADGVRGERFRSLAEELSDAVLVVDTDSVIRYANPASEEIFGYDPEALVGESLTTLMPRDLAERHREAIGRYLREGERHVDGNYLELPGEHRNGTEIPLAVSFREFTSGDELRFTGLVRDVSDPERREPRLHDRVRQQEALATFSRRALGEQSVADLMDEAADLVVDALDGEYGEVLELRPEAGDLQFRAGTGWHEGLVESGTVDADRDSQAGRALADEEPVVVKDLGADERFSETGPLASRDVTSGIFAVIGSPDDPWGVLGTHDTERRSYTAHDVRFVCSIANVLATAVGRRERERRLERSEAMLDAVDDGVYALDADSRFVAVNDAYLELTGYDRDDLLGEHATTVVGEDRDEVGERVQERLEAGEEVVTLELSLPTADGETIPIEARVAPLPLDGKMGRVGVVRDVTDRQRREAKLTSLNQLFRSLADAETRTEICELAVTAAVETLELPNAAVAMFDDEAGALVPTVRRWEGDDIDDALLGRDAEDAAWQAFVDGESRSYDDLAAERDADAEAGSALAIPLGKFGVFVAAADERAAFDATDRSLADLLCSNVRSALGRAEREETLRTQRDDLREKNRELERADRLNRVIREITKALTRAATQDDVMQAVCDRLTDTGPYRFAWFGTPDPATGDVRVQASAGDEDGYLDEIRVTADGGDEHGRGPSGRAVRTGDVEVQNDLLADPPFEPWREQALKRGFRSSASVPVVYDGTLRGLLNLYADEAGAFEGTERDVLSELGETIGYALNALEQERALVSERSVDLDFRIGGTGSAVLSFVAERDAEFEFENAVRRTDGRLHAFFTVRDAAPEETLAYAGDVEWVEDVRLVTEREGEYLYECTVTEDSFLQSLVNRGAMPRTFTATESGGRFVVRVSHNADVRTFVDLFEEHYDEARLVARRERDEPVLTRQEFEADLSDRLTDRQREVLRTAYFSGFFEWPRERTAEEIAESLDVSQPTVSRHVRAGERALFDLLFGDR